VASARLYVGNLSYNTTDADLRTLFGGTGQVVDAKIVTEADPDRADQRRSRGFGFVDMSSAAEAQASIQAHHGTQFGGRRIIVSEAKEKERRPRQDRPQESQIRTFRREDSVVNGSRRW
jgi:RNA recognition motif-containing protein